MIHPTAVIHQNAQIGQDCEIGPFCVIGEHVVLGDRCRLLSHVVIDGHTTIGSENRFYPFCSVGLRTQDLKWNGGVTSTTIGDRNVIRESVTIHSATGDGEATAIGSDNNLLAYCHIAHNVTLGNHIIMSNVGALAGHVTVEDYAVIGGLAGVHQFCQVGKYSIIGGCSKVVKDVPPFMMVDGNPARTRAINKVGLTRNGFATESQAAIRKAYKILFRSGAATAQAVQRIKNELPRTPETEHLLKFIENSQRGLA
ncbi:MAG: Acyl-[acyl-carrier-protein]--UDP-N-acetylglucosamine O-acyltransferase [Verrucomicrobia subdivision 3 bacterium]|nr:Acyl-[acyl-carrier-protein]--UDP-N-acetylglucosamine O-acyltransferase [Limisphaerales bacterium]MCS1414939.1 Acyl-[acyl-carrier-protein]--UDP-N-acetylglucosamine O-acyltransferase [Limisphaerales bacterium]